MGFSRSLKSGIKQLPYLRGVMRRVQTLETERTQLLAESHLTQENLHAALEERDQVQRALALSQQHRFPLWVYPGHYYSPFPAEPDLRTREEALWGPAPGALPAVNLQEANQVALLEALAGYSPEMPFTNKPQPGLRYYFENEMFGQADAMYLYSLLRHLQPKHIIEVGSGFSSAVMLDTSERFLKNQPTYTFIEPYPERLYSLLLETDRAHCEVLEQPVQQVALSRFTALSAHDILFIDSSHVSKTGSDVNYLLFEILPALQPGVYVHIHDVFYPFEYPRSWVYEGRGWNEDYLVRAFLQYNAAFEIVLYADFLARRHPTTLETLLPCCLANTGASLWLKKVS